MHDPSGHEREQPGDVERKGRHGGKGRDGNLGNGIEQRCEAHGGVAGIMERGAGGGAATPNFQCKYH
jgi:hypothetical protein